MMAEMEAKQAHGPSAEPEPAQPTPEQISAYMAKLGTKGGKVSGTRRMKMPAEQRRAIALKAARARWGKRKTSDGA